VPSDVAGVPGGQGCIPPAPGCAVRRQAPAVAGAAWGLQGPRYPVWLVHACIVVSLGGWHAPEEAGRFGGEEDGMGVQRRKASRARQGCSTHSCRIADIASSYTYAPDCMPFTAAAIVNSALSFVSGPRRFGVVCRRVDQTSGCAQNSPLGAAIRGEPSSAVDAHIRLFCRLAAWRRRR
jgi:hypothetical protein